MTNALTCLVYVSSATWLLADEELEDILTSSRENNQRHGVTGALLYNDGTFFQYIEGPPSGMAQVYGVIRNSRRHRGIIELMSEDIPERRFPEWYIGFFQPTESEMLNLSNRTWWTVAETLDDAPHPEGINLLEMFCRSSGRG